MSWHQQMMSQVFMKIVMIGAGNVATHLAKALVAAGHEIVQVWSRTADSALSLASAVGAEPLTDMACVCDDAGLYVLSVSDSALADVAGCLAHRRVKGVVAHTAGTVSMDVLRECGPRYGVIYPMQTFSKSVPVCFRHVPCFVEASDRDVTEFLKTVAESVSDNVRELTGQDRRWLHVAAVLACNFANACYAMAADVLESHGIDFSVMLPLIDETARKVHDVPPAKAQTGPAAREDYNVMASHRALLSENASVLKVYDLMSQVIIERQCKARAMEHTPDAESQPVL